MSESSEQACRELERLIPFVRTRIHFGVQNAPIGTHTAIVTRHWCNNVEALIGVMNDYMIRAGGCELDFCSIIAAILREAICAEATPKQPTIETNFSLYQPRSRTSKSSLPLPEEHEVKSVASRLHEAVETLSPSKQEIVRLLAEAYMHEPALLLTNVHKKTLLTLHETRLFLQLFYRWRHHRDHTTVEQEATHFNQICEAAGYEGYTETLTYEQFRDLIREYDRATLFKLLRWGYHLVHGRCVEKQLHRKLTPTTNHRQRRALVLIAFLLVLTDYIRALLQGSHRDDKGTQGISQERYAIMRIQGYIVLPLGLAVLVVRAINSMYHRRVEEYAEVTKASIIAYYLWLTDDPITGALYLLQLFNVIGLYILTALFCPDFSWGFALPPLVTTFFYTYEPPHTD